MKPLDQAQLAEASPAQISDSREAAEVAGLTYVNDSDPGIGRRKVGKGFAYTTSDGKRVTDEATLARIRSLAIPPAYTDVWICADPDGHIQATGRASASFATVRSTSTCSPSRGRFPASAPGSPSTWRFAACRARKCLRPSSTCSKRR
jgi:DNA topoisomerase IB